MSFLRVLSPMLLLMFLAVQGSAQLLAPAVPMDVLPDSLWYFAQERPGRMPAVLAPGFVSLPGRNEARLTFSPDGRTAFFYVEFWPSPGIPYILQSDCIGGVWTTPDSASFTKGRKTGEPIFAPDGQRVYLNATNVTGQIGSIDLSVATKTPTGWSDPVSLGAPPNLAQDQYHACVVADTSIYLSSSSGAICRCQWRNGHYEPRTTLPAWINGGNTSSTWGDPYVAPDEHYMIFHSTRTGGMGGADLYITYRTSTGDWTNPKNLGPGINTSADELGGDVTPDGKYMIFNRSGDIYWVSTWFVDSLRQTNFVPYVRRSISPRSDTVGRQFLYTVPDSTFNDDDGNATLHYRASLSNGNPLPAWLQFDSSSCTFSGVPTTAGNVVITLTAIDTAGAQVSLTFTLHTVSVTAIEQHGEQRPFELRLDQNWPNPSNPSSTIAYQVGAGSRQNAESSRQKAVQVKLAVYDLLGREVAVLVDGHQLPGEHRVVFNGSTLASGVYFYHLTSEGQALTKRLVLLK